MKNKSEKKFMRLLCALLVLLQLLCVSCTRRQTVSQPNVENIAAESDPIDSAAAETDAPTEEEVVETVGVGVAKVTVDKERHLILTLNDGTKTDAGYIGGEPDVKGCYVTFVDYNDRVLKFEIVEKGGNSTPPDDPHRAHYVFAGWDNSYENITKDTVITATYTEQTETVTEPIYYTVSFEDYDGTTLLTQTVEAGHSATPPTGMEREGYIFQGWDKSFDCIVADTVLIAQYREDTTPIISVGDVVAQSGEGSVEVTVEIRNNPGVAGMSFTVGYDSTALSLADVSYGDAFAEGGEKPNLSSAPVTILWTGLEEVDSDTTYVVLTFDILDEAESGENYPITLSYDENDVFDLDEENVAFEVKNGSIAIQ